MDIPSLISFITVTETLNYRRAAELLFVTQPTLTRQVKKLEQELGVSLFYRDTRSVTPTPAGEAALPYARAIVQKQAAMQRRMQAIQGEMPCSFTVGYHGRGNIPYLHVLQEQCKASLPHVQMRVVWETAPNLLEQFAQTELDALMLLEPCVVDIKHIEKYVVAHEAPCTVLPKAHPLASQKEVPIQMLSNEHLFLHEREKSHEIFDALIKLCSDAGFVPKVRGTGADDFIYFSVLAKEGVGLFPTFTHKKDTVPKGIVLRPLAGVTEGFHRVLVWKSKHANACFIMERLLADVAVAKTT